MANEEKFTGKADVYEFARPGYAPELLAYLARAEGFGPGVKVADIGSGTGRFAGQLLSLGCDVVGVEPNDNMRAIAERNFDGEAGFSSVKGTAEATGLATASVDRVSVAQAFHWVDADAFRSECQRILRPQGTVALVWNFRDLRSELVYESALVCEEYCPDFTGFSGGLDFDGDVIARFFGGTYRTVQYPHDLTYTRDGFIKRMLSSSYAPAQDDPAHTAFAEAFGHLFDRYAEAETLTLPNNTVAYIGALA